MYNKFSYVGIPIPSSKSISAYLSNFKLYSFFPFIGFSLIAFVPINFGFILPTKDSGSPEGSSVLRPCSLYTTKFEL